MFDNYPHVAGQFYGTPWLITEAKFDEIEAALVARIRSGPMTFDDGPRADRPKKRDIREVRGDIGLIQIQGTITPRPSLFSSGGASCKEIGDELDEMVANPDVSAIVLHFDTPGGQVFGIEELGQKIAAAKKMKPVHSVAQHMACSAGLWLATQATSFSVAPNAWTGSCGVIMKHSCTAKFDERVGVSYTTITAGRRKAEADSSFPLSEEARKHFQDQCDALYEKFVSAVASGRSVSKETVRSAEWGEGAVLLAEDAVKCGMADRIATVDEVVAQLRGKGNDSRKRKMVMAEAAAKALL